MTTEIDSGAYQWHQCPHCDEMVPWNHVCHNDPEHDYTVATFTDPYSGKTMQRYIELTPEAQESLKSLYKE